MTFAMRICRSRWFRTFLGLAVLCVLILEDLVRGCELLDFLLPVRALLFDVRRMHLGGPEKTRADVPQRAYIGAPAQQCCRERHRCIRVGQQPTKGRIIGDKRTE